MSKTPRWFYVAFAGATLLSSISFKPTTPSAVSASSPAATVPPAAKPVAMNKSKIKQLIEPSTVMINSGKEIGSGSIIANNQVLTCDHVIRNEQPINVRLADKQTTYPATVIKRDRANDLAIIQVHSDRALSAIKFAEEATEGETIFALGSPYGSQGAISQGIVTGYRQGDVVFKATGEERINPGNSGGPGVNDRGEQNSVVCGVDRDDRDIAFARSIFKAKQLLEAK